MEEGSHSGRMWSKRTQNLTWPLSFSEEPLLKLRAPETIKFSLSLFAHWEVILNHLSITWAFNLLWNTRPNYLQPQLARVSYNKRCFIALVIGQIQVGMLQESSSSFSLKHLQKIVYVHNTIWGNQQDFKKRTKKMVISLSSLLSFLHGEPQHARGKKADGTNTRR